MPGIIASGGCLPIPGDLMTSPLGSGVAHLCEEKRWVRERMGACNPQAALSFERGLGSGQARPLSHLEEAQRDRARLARPY